jgi:hypothetical protein
MTANAALEEELGALIRSSAPDIVRNVITKAQEGSYLHAKFLFELAGIDLTQTAESGGRRRVALGLFAARTQRPQTGQRARLVQSVLWT